MHISNTLILYFPPAEWKELFLFSYGNTVEFFMGKNKNLK